jgi:hypothetical protein
MLRYPTGYGPPSGRKLHFHAVPAAPSGGGDWKIDEALSLGIGRSWNGESDSSIAER